MLRNILWIPVLASPLLLEVKWIDIFEWAGGRRFASMLNQPSGRATRCDQHAWQHFYCMMQRLHPERQYAGPDDVRMWDLRPDSKNMAPTREDWLCFQHFSRVISSSTDAARNNVCAHVVREEIGYAEDMGREICCRQDRSFNDGGGTWRRGAI